MLAAMRTLMVVSALGLLLAGCGAGTGMSPGFTAPAASQGAIASSPPAETPVLNPSGTSLPSLSATASPGTEPAVVDPPAGVLPPGSVARVTADGLRVRGAAPGVPGHDEVVYTLNAGDLVLVQWSPLAYVAPSESHDGRGWYSIHVGGHTVDGMIDGGVTGWIAAGGSGLEYLEIVPVSCRAERDLANLVYAPFTQGADNSTFATPWERLACNSDRPLELTGIFDHVCPEGGVYPYRFSPHLAHPQWCTALLIDAIDADGYPRFGRGLIVRLPEFAPTDIERGDVLEVRGHFDDPQADSCVATTEAGFQGPAVDPAFLQLFCREQFVPDDWAVVDHRDLAPLPWSP